METNDENSSRSGAVGANGAAASVGWTAPGASLPRGLQSKLARMLAGLEAAVPDGASVQVRGQLVAKSDLEDQMTQILAVFQTLETALTAVNTARAQLNAQLRGFNRQYLGFRNGLVALLGRDNPRLEQLGVAVAVPSKPLTSEQSVVRAAKARETRELRHTLGKRQKAKIQYTGDLQVAVGEVAAPGSEPETGPPPGRTE